MLIIHTLGPIGTNCEKAAYYWLKQKNLDGKVILHETLEVSVEKIKK
ncbi:hypothetical protein M2263_003037 [Providencia alcalifaciens]|nr:hypothetical protein [Providencia alcalifaciens]